MRRDRGRDESAHRDRDSDWERRYDDETLLRTPESLASSSSYHPSQRRYHHYEYRRDPSTTPSQSVASSMTSVLTPHPPRSSVTRQSNASYRRPSVSMRGALSGVYDDEVLRESRRSQSRSRSIPVVPSAPPSQRSSRTLRTASVSSSDSGSDAELVYDSRDRGRRSPNYRETRIVRVNRDERSRSRTDTDIRSRRRQRLREDSISPDEDDYDEMDTRHLPQVVERSRDRAPPRQRPRSHSRPASVRHVQQLENDAADDGDSDEPPAHEVRDRLDRRDSRRHRHESRTSRGHRRNRSESHSKRSPPSARYVLSAALLGKDPGSSRRASPSKRYYESEFTSVDRRDRFCPPSTSLRRPNTVSGPRSVAASQHQSVSSSTKRSSTFLGNFFGSSRYGHSQHRASGKPVKV